MCMNKTVHVCVWKREGQRVRMKRGGGEERERVCVCFVCVCMHAHLCACMRICVHAHLCAHTHAHVLFLKGTYWTAKTCELAAKNNLTERWEPGRDRLQTWQHRRSAESPRRSSGSNICTLYYCVLVCKALLQSWQGKQGKKERWKELNWPARIHSCQTLKVKS